MNLAKSVLQLFTSRVAKAIINFTAVIVFSRLLGASPLGSYYPFIALLGIISVPASFGINGAIEKRISEGDDQAIFLGTALSVKFSIVLFFCLILYLFRSSVNLYLGKQFAILLIVTLFVDQIGGIFLPVLRGELRVGETALLEILRPVCWLIFGYFFYTLDYGVYGLVYGYLIGTCLQLLAGWWKTSIEIGHPSYQHACSLIDYGKYSMILHLGGTVFSWIDVAILSFFVVGSNFLTRGDIGAYENAWRLSLIAVMASRAISTAVFPQFSRWDAEGARDQIEDLIPKAALPSLLIVIPSFVGTAILSRELLTILFGSEFAVASLSLIILSAGMIVQSIHGVVAQPLQAIDRPDLAACATIIGIVSNIVLNISLVWKFGIAGAAVATAVSFTVNTILHVLYLRNFLTIHLPWREATWGAVAAVIMGVVIYTLRMLISTTTMIDLSVIILTGIVVYSVLALAYTPIRTTARQLFQQLISD